MKIKGGFSLRKIAGMWVVLPLGARTLDFTGVLTLNETGRMLWELLAEGSNRPELAEALVSEYDIPIEQAQADVNEFLESLVSAGCLAAE